MCWIHWLGVETISLNVNCHLPFVIVFHLFHDYIELASMSTKCSVIPFRETDSHVGNTASAHKLDLRSFDISSCCLYCASFFQKVSVTFTASIVAYLRFILMLFFSVISTSRLLSFVNFGYVCVFSSSNLIFQCDYCVASIGKFFHFFFPN